MKAILLAGGKGTRLHPFSATLPKPLMPLGDMPILELLMRQLRSFGVTDVVLAVNHLRHLIEAFFGDGSRFGLNVTYSIEDRPLGTAGPIAAVIDQMSDDFILANGDLLTTLDVGRMVQAHRATGAEATVGVYERELKIDFGLVDVDERMRLLGYTEKPTYKHLVSMGIYVLKRDAIAEHLRTGESIDMPDVIRAMVGRARNVQCHRQDCFWLDIGRPDDFALAQRLYDEEPDRFLPRA